MHFEATFGQQRNDRKGGRDRADAQRARGIADRRPGLLAQPFAFGQCTTSGDETYRFRFLTLRADGGAGEIDVDLNRAYLPPCAFSDFYVCPLPPLQNRLTVPVRAGEKTVVRKEAA